MTKEYAIAYLSQNFKGIGPKKAEKIIAITGSDLIEYFKGNDFTGLYTILKSEKVEELRKRILTDSQTPDIYDYINGFGLKYSHALALSEYSDGLALLKSSPYVVCEHIGLDFYIADRIALDNGFEATNKKRMKALIMETMKQNEQEGHTYILINDLLKKVNEVNSISSYPQSLPESEILANVIDMYELYIDEEATPHRVYTFYSWTNEEKIVKNIERIQNGRNSFELNNSEETIEKIQEKNNIRYAESQIDAILSVKNKISIITGGAGTGKTTVIKGIIDLFTINNEKAKIKLAAPTGRAAQRMAEATGREATTIHKLLEYAPFGNIYKCKNAYDRIDADLIIIDEASMIDTELFTLLLEAIPHSCHLILCGDPFQLQSVGAGNVLLDLIKSNKINTYELDVIYRQAEGNLIVKNAERIKKKTGRIETGPNFHHIQIKDLDLLKTLIKEPLNINNMNDIQILSPIKNGVYGINNINQIIQNVCNGSEENQIIYGNHRYKLNDKVIFNHNNYELGYYNGDIGIIEDIGEKIRIDIGRETISLPRTELKDIDLAYCTTIHKSQGSEYKTVVIVIPDSAKRMLNRKLLYTAITRATEKVIILEQGYAIEYAMNNDKQIFRNTGLYEKLLKN